MKKILSIVIASILLLATCVSIASCGLLGNTATSNPIDFGKKYSRNTGYYVFNSDGTGYYEYNYYVTSSNSQCHGRVDFVWREASDGAVYLFSVDSMTYEDHTYEYKDSVTSMGIYFSDDFLVYSYTSVSSYGGESYSRKYIKEGSDLEKLLED